MASTFAEAKVRVNCIAPGVFQSEMTAGSSGDDQKSKLDMEMSNPAGKQIASCTWLKQLLILVLDQDDLAAMLIWPPASYSSPGQEAYSSTRRFCILMEVNHRSWLFLRIDTNLFRQHTRAACSYMKKRKPYCRQLKPWHRSRTLGYNRSTM